MIEQKILLPERNRIDRYGRIKIRAPHCKQYRRYEHDSEYATCCFNAVLTAIDQTNLFPLPESLKERLDQVVARIDIPLCQWAIDPDEERKYVQKKIADCVQSLKSRKDKQYFSPFDFAKRHPYAEFLLGHAISPEDFSFDQRLKLFGYFSTKVMNEIEEDYVHKASPSYRSYGPHDAPQIVARESGTLRDWNEKGKSQLLSQIDGYIAMESAVRDLEMYDWSPLAFILGENITTFAQLNKAALQSELKISQDVIRQEFANFCSAVNGAAQLGTMRSNVVSFNASLVNKYEFCATVRDTGGGAVLTKGVRDVVGGTASDVKDIALGVGALAALPFALLFGGGKKK